MFLTGVIQAFIVLLLTAVFNVYVRVGVLLYDLQGVLFTCITIISASFILLVYAGPGKLGISSFKNIATWGYGFCNIAQYILDIYLTKYVSATELSLFSRLTIPVSIILAFIFLKRKPEKLDILAVLVILAGSIILFYIQDIQYLNVIILLVSLAAIFFAAEMFFTETHQQSAAANKEGNIRDRARVVGFASFITSIIFLFLAMTCAVLKDIFHIQNTVVQALPSFKEYFHFPTIISAFFYGCVIASVARFFTWSATYKIKTENVLAILVLVPITTYLLEVIVSKLFSIDINSQMFAGDRGIYLIYALILMTFGSMISIVPKIIKNINKKPDETWVEALKNSVEKQDNDYEIQHSALDSSDYEVIEQTYAFYDNDTDKVAELFNISTDAVKIILLGKSNNCFIDEVSNEIHKIYRNTIVLRDKLTKAKNRMCLTKDFNQLKEQESLSLALLDLDDFKPVNDTYGHEAGDLVLIKVVEKLEALYPQGVYRLGGDEFVIIAQNIDSKAVKEIISKRIKFESNYVKVTGSLGLVKLDENFKTLDELLEKADDLAYIDKKTQKALS